MGACYTADQRNAKRKRRTASMSPSFLDRGTHKLAFEKTDGNAPTLVWLGGFRSDMTGSKAMKVEEYAKERGQACLRFDYAGHGQSTGAFTDGTIGSWRDDAAAMIEAEASGETIWSVHRWEDGSRYCSPLMRPKKQKPKGGRAASKRWC
jgi:pimeloyl-ACP methyl ester carboxylesterase